MSPSIQGAQIGPGLESEKPACVAIYNEAMRREVGDAHWELDLQGWDEVFEDARWADWLVARKDGSPVGFIASCGYAKGQDLIQMLAVGGQAKGMGVGGALVSAAKEAASARGCERLRAYVREEAKGAQAFYRKAKGRIGYADADVDAYGEKVFPVDFALAAPRLSPKR